jgi:hypothetical protein
LLTFTRQQGLDPVKQQVTVSATHEDIDTCNEVYPKKIYTYVSAGLSTNTTEGIGQRYLFLQSIETRDKIITDGYIYKLTKQLIGNPMLVLFGGVIGAYGKLTGNPPEVKGWKATKPNQAGGFEFIYLYTKGTFPDSISFYYDWTQTSYLLDETDITTYENIPIDSQNPSKILSRVITRSEPWAKYPDGLQYFGVSEWFVVNVNDSRRITERTTTTYEYVEIVRDDIIVQTGQRLYEIKKITELKEVVYFKRTLRIHSLQFSQLRSKRKNNHYIHKAMSGALDRAQRVLSKQGAIHN